MSIILYGTAEPVNPMLMFGVMIAIIIFIIILDCWAGWRSGENE